MVCAASEAWQLTALCVGSCLQAKQSSRKRFRRMVGPFASYDIIIDGSHDLLTQAGLLEAMHIMYAYL